MLSNKDLPINKDLQGEKSEIFKAIEAKTEKRKKEFAAKKENVFCEEAKELLNFPVIDNPDSRFEMLRIYKNWILSEKGKNQVDSLAGIETTKQQRLQIVAEFVMKASYFLVREFRVNKLGGWIKVVLNKKNDEKPEKNRLGISGQGVKWVVEQLQADRQQGQS